MQVSHQNPHYRDADSRAAVTPVTYLFPYIAPALSAFVRCYPAETLGWDISCVLISLFLAKPATFRTADVRIFG
jgi:sorbitol-specific phosphotransferase system component IIC